MSMMIFGTLFFSGLFLMFVFILFGQERLHKNVRREMEAQRAQLALLEARLAAYESKDGQGTAQDPITFAPVGTKSGASISPAGSSLSDASVKLSF